MTSLEREIVELPGRSLSPEAEAMSPVQCVRVGNWVRVAGQVPVDASGETVSRELEPQVRQVYENIEMALTAAGSSLADMIHQVVWLTDMRHARRCLEIRSEVMGPDPEDRSTSSLVGTSALGRPEWLVEIEATAILSDGSLEKQVIEVPGLSNPQADDDFDRGYVQCLRAGDFVSVAGQVGLDDHHDPMSFELGPQVGRTYDCIERALDAAGSGIGELLYQTAWLTDRRYVEDYLDRVPASPTAAGFAGTLLATPELGMPELLVEVEPLGLVSAAPIEKEVHDVPGLPPELPTDGPPHHTGGTADCVTAGEWVFLSGQVGLDEDNDVVSPRFEPQVRQAFGNVETALEYVGSGFDGIYHLRVYLDAMERLETFRSIRDEVLGDARATGTVVETTLASEELHVELDVRAVLLGSGNPSS